MKIMKIMEIMKIIENNENNKKVNQSNNQSINQTIITNKNKKKKITINTKITQKNQKIITQF